MPDASPFVLLSCPQMRQFGEGICQHLEERGVAIPHYGVTYTRFANGEFLPQIPHTIRHQHVFVLHALQFPDPNTALMKLLLTNDAVKRASASGLTLVLPYIPYLRQDRKDKPRVPISARAVADIIESNSAVEALITIDMHADQEQGFFSIPVDNLQGTKVFADYVRRYGDMTNIALLAPDFGGAVRNRRMARLLGDAPVSILEKRRTGANKAEILSVIGPSIADKMVFIHEDMIDTGGTAIKSIRKILEMPERPAAVMLCATHGIFSANVFALFDELRRTSSVQVQVISTDSIPRQADWYYNQKSWLKCVSLIPYFADAIFEQMQVGGSISKLSE